MARSRSRNSRFQHGSGCYKCVLCGRLTRHTGEQALGSELCPECWNIAGEDNAINDNGLLDGPRDAKTVAYLKGLLEVIHERGGDTQRVLDHNDFVRDYIKDAACAS